MWVGMAAYGTGALQLSWGTERFQATEVPFCDRAGDKKKSLSVLSLDVHEPFTPFLLQFSHSTQSLR